MVGVAAASAAGPSSLVWLQEETGHESMLFRNREGERGREGGWMEERDAAHKAVVFIPSLGDSLGLCP